MPKILGGTADMEILHLTLNLLYGFATPHLKRRHMSQFCDVDASQTEVYTLHTTYAKVEQHSHTTPKSRICLAC